MPKIDFKKVHKDLYNPPRSFVEIDVPELKFLMIDGHGDPNVAHEYQEALAALYGVAYKIKFFSKKELGKDYVVPPLEGLWWAENMNSYTVLRNKSEWDWTMMIMTPVWILPEYFQAVIDEIDKGNSLVALHKIRLEPYHEGLSIQIMHIGSYDDEAPILAKLHDEFLPKNGYIENGKHHEIYLSDPRRTAPDKLRTILRQPVKLVDR